MNRNAKMAIGFTLTALLFSSAHAQTTTRLTQSGDHKTLVVMVPHGESYAFHSGQPEGGGQSDMQIKDDLFAGTEQFAKNASDVTEITMDPESLDLVKGNDAQHAHSLVLNVVRTYTYDKPGMYNMAEVDAYRNKLNTGDWHCSVHVREMKRAESTDVCNKRRSDGMKETAIITVEPKELTFIHTVKREGAGHSEMSDYTVFTGESLPMVAGIMGSASMAEMQAQMQVARAQMEVDRAKMQAFGPGDPFFIQHPGVGPVFSPQHLMPRKGLKLKLETVPPVAPLEPLRRPTE